MGCAGGMMHTGCVELGWGRRDLDDYDGRIPNEVFTQWKRGSRVDVIAEYNFGRG